MKENKDSIYFFRISSADKNYEMLNQFLLEHFEVKSFDD
jgi:hypothetical protein